MSSEDFSKIHTNGDLPIKVLKNNVLDWFINVDEDFSDEILTQSTLDDLKRGIGYHITKAPITEIAYIKFDHSIHLFENYFQFLWCVSYLLNILFHKGFVDEIKKENYSGTIEIDSYSKRIACDVFDAGFSLLSKYEKDQFYDLPNPENYEETEKSDVEETNSVYTAASVFCLMHEYAHHYYRHVDYYSDTKKSIKEELIADEYAIDKIKANFSNEKHDSYKFGIIAALASLIFMNESLTDQGNHPDLDTRLNHALRMFDLDKTDSLWALACLVFSVWSKKYDKGLYFPQTVNTYKDLYEQIIEQLKELK